MGSVFTYNTDPDLPKVSSPWLPPESGPKIEGTRSETATPQGHHSVLSDYGVTKLIAEPQDGPTEYKLHLLLRPRRTFLSLSTNTNDLPTAPPMLSSSSQTRQSRLQHLTTQLLWRLRQSSPFHSTSSKDLVLPQLPDDNIDLNAASITPGRLLPGLEESRGALYEIGVSDDGTLVGLTNDEMDDSMATLRIMAATLGCRVEILRTVTVGDCEWADGAEGEPAVRCGELWVVEALVEPDINSKADESSPPSPSPITMPTFPPHAMSVTTKGHSTTDQLRITLTGPTTSGKSTLLGTLSSGSLDDGRGMSRISMLKHRHEMASGVTSSVSQELVGYKDNAILNYSDGNIESWDNIHDCAEGGRLVFMSDSGGHPRYRRTVLRGLVGWDPHWTILCVAGNDTNLSPGAVSPTQDTLGTTSSGIDFAQAHLELCLTLKIPLAVVITKMDLTTKTTLQRVIGKVLTSVKAVGRTPRIIHPDQKSHATLQHVPREDHAKVQAVVGSMGGYEHALSCVPILLTSAVRGTGIGLMHALLESLPLPPKPTASDFIGMALNPEQPRTLFHVDDTFTLPSTYASLACSSEHDAGLGIVVSGYLRFGRLCVGENVMVGPFPSEDDESAQSTPEGGGLSISHPSSSELARIVMSNSVSASAVKGQWHTAQIVSVRNLRLPVLGLEAGQAGSIGIVFNVPPPKGFNEALFQALRPTPPRIRRGMVIAIPSRHMMDTGLSLQAASNITASFDDPDATVLPINSLVNIYVANVAAVARIQSVTITDPPTPSLSRATTDEMDEVFRLSEQIDDAPQVTAGRQMGVVQVSLELLNHREWIEMGSRILILEGGRQDRSGLEGFLGKVVEIVD